METPSPEINPPLNCSLEDLLAWLKTLKPGDRVQELGRSCMTGQTGTVEIREGVPCIRWDTEFEEGTGLVTSFTGGARKILVS